MDIYFIQKTLERLFKNVDTSRYGVGVLRCRS
jgi:hypothetical protein